MRPDPGPRPAARALLALAVLAATPALAHPDIAMECRVLFDFEAGRVTGIGEAWTFDPAFSAQLLADYDTDRDGAFGEAEAAAIEREVFGNLAAGGYYTAVTLDGAALPPMTPFGFRAGAAGGAVTFAFGLRLPEPVDPAAHALHVVVRDPDFAVQAVLPAEGATLLRGDEPGQRCRTSIVADREHPIFDGTVYPDEIRLRCGG